MNGRPPEIPPHKLIRSLHGFDLLPAIVFMPTRRRCDEAAAEVAGDRSQPFDQAKFERRKAIFESFAEREPEVRTHKHVKTLINAGVASHHAGHIPVWKLLVEKMMSSGVLNAIFATSTVAAGVDFPARTVVITNADTRGNDGWRSLTANELQQMTGRAGRRGKDNVGFVVLVPGQFQDPKKIASLLKMPPDPLESRFRATYTTILNLLDAFKNFEQLREVTEKSFAFRDMGHRIEGLRKISENTREAIRQRLDLSGLSLSLNDVIGFERLAEARRRVEERPAGSHAERRGTWIKANLKAGQVVTKAGSRKRLYFILQINEDVIYAIAENGQGSSFPVSKIDLIFKKAHPVREKEIETAFADVREKRDVPLEEPSFENKNGKSDPAVELLTDLMDKFAADPERRDEYMRVLWENAADADKLLGNERDIAFYRERIWLPFEQRARVLDNFGYLDLRKEQVTERGKWLADLRIDRPLVAGEALEHGIFSDLDPAIAAGVMAALAADPDRNFGELYLSEALMSAVSEVEAIIRNISKAERRYGIEPVQDLNSSAAAAVERWASGMSWRDLVRKTGAEEGDLFRLLSRTGEALLQIAHLRDSHPKASSAAMAATEIILRDPIR